MLYNGATPTLELSFKSVDLTEGRNHTVTFSYPVSEKRILELSGESLVVTEHEIDVFMTQEQSFLMPKPEVLVQVNWLYDDGTRVIRAVSDKKTIQWDSNLKKEVME